MCICSCVVVCVFLHVYTICTCIGLCVCICTTCMHSTCVVRWLDTACPQLSCLGSRLSRSAVAEAAGGRRNAENALDSAVPSTTPTLPLIKLTPSTRLHNSLFRTATEKLLKRVKICLLIFEIFDKTEQISFQFENIKHRNYPVSWPYSECFSFQHCSA